MSGAPFQYRTLNTDYAGVSASGSDQGAQQFGLRSYDADFSVRDLYTLSQGAQVIAAVATTFQPDALTGRAGEGSDHIEAESLVAGTFERSLGALGVGAGLFTKRIEADDALFEARGVEIGDA